MENKKDQILAAAEKEFMRHGFGGARTMVIAKEAGVTHAMLHYYFNTKAQLFQEILSAKLELFQQSVNLGFLPNEEMSVKEQILDKAARHFDFLAANRELPRFIFTNMVNKEAFQVAREKIFPIFHEKMNAFGKLMSEQDIAIDPFTLAQDILLLNLSTFLLLTVIEQSGLDTEAYLRSRRDEMLKLLTLRLCCSNTTAS